MISGAILDRRNIRLQMEMSDLGAYIKRRIDQLGISQTQLAERAGMPVASLNAIINRPALTPRLESLAQLSTALDVPLVRLVELAGFNPGSAGDVPASLIRRAQEDPELASILDEMLRLRPDDRAALRGYIQALLSRKN